MWKKMHFCCVHMTSIYQDIERLTERFYYLECYLANPTQNDLKDSKKLKEKQCKIRLNKHGHKKLIQIKMAMS